MWLCVLLHGVVASLLCGWQGRDAVLASGVQPQHMALAWPLQVAHTTVLCMG